MRIRTKILLISFGTLTVSIITLSSIFPIVKFVTIVLLGPPIYVLTFPIYVTFVFIDILYPALILSLATSVIMALVLKHRTKLGTYFRFLCVITIFGLIYVKGSIFLSEIYISTIAKKEYNVEVQAVNINLGAWYKVGLGDFMGLPSHDRHLGKAHGYIYLNGCKSNWSFFERQFTNVCKK